MDLFSQAFDHHNRLKAYSSHVDALDKSLINPFVIFLAVSTFLLSADQYVGSSMQCWISEDTAHMGQYKNFAFDVCHLNYTRYIPEKLNSDDTKLNFDDIKHSTIITYYPWLPFILIFTIVIYILPIAFLNLTLRNVPINIVTLIQTAENYSISADEATKTETIRKIVKSLNEYITQHRWNQITLIFFSFKFLLLICHIVAVFSLCQIFGTEYLFFGPNFLYDLIQNGKVASDIFPLEVWCDINVVTQSNSGINDRTIPCLLTTNIFSCFVFCILNIIQWFGILTAIVNLFSAAAQLSIYSRQRFLSKYMYGFTESYGYDAALDTLRYDGITVLRMMAANSNEIAVSEIVQQLCRVNKRAQFFYKEESETGKEE